MELIVNWIKRLSEVDPESVVLFGGSLGGHISIRTAAKTQVAAVIAGEPANVKSGATEEIVEDLFQRIGSFLNERIKTKPTPIEK